MLKLEVGLLRLACQNSHHVNGTTSKRLKSQHGDVEIETPLDRDGTFAPQLLHKNQTRLTQMEKLFTPSCGALDV